MHVRVAQLDVMDDVAANTERIVAVLDDSMAGEVVVFPEAALSGYRPEKSDWLHSLDVEEIREGLAEVGDAAARNDVRAIVGSVSCDSDGWSNATFLFAGGGTPSTYRKVNLATLDRAHFVPGDHLPTFVLDGVTVGVQMCREVMFPEQWLKLRMDGAAVIFHVNNALRDRDGRWRHVLVTRAMENQCFVVSVNAAAPGQSLPSFVIAPDGKLLVETTGGRDDVQAVRLNLATATGDYVAQRRDDVVSIAARPH